MKLKNIFLAVIPAIIILAVIIIGASGTYVVNENESACVVRFSAIVDTVDDAGLYFRIPFVDQVKYFNKATNMYDLPESEVLTADKKNMTVNRPISPWGIQ
mgnify:CR=1 FL=1